MAKIKEKNNFRKILNWILAMIAIVLLIYVLFKGYNVYKESLLDKSVLNRVVGNINIDDVSTTKVELPNYAFIIVSYTNSDDNRKVEKDLKDLILKYNLQENFYYLDVKDFVLEDNYIDKLNSKLKLSNGNKIVNLPSIIYYKNDKIVKTINLLDGNLNIDELKNLLVSEQIIEK